MSAYPGVPQLKKESNFKVIQKVSLGALQGALWHSLQVSDKWGIYDKNNKNIFADKKFSQLVVNIINSFGGTVVSTNSFDYSKEMRVSDFPIENGGFASYNKVEMPATPVVSFAISGSESARKDFLETIDKAVKSTDIYTIVTPEKKYTSHTLERYSFSRKSSKGVTLLIVDIALREVRTVSAQYTKTTPKEVGATQKVDNGKVQPTTPSKSVLKSIAPVFENLFNPIKAILGL